MGDRQKEMRSNMGKGMSGNEGKRRRGRIWEREKPRERDDVTPGPESNLSLSLCFLLFLITSTRSLSFFMLSPTASATRPVSVCLWIQKSDHTFRTRNNVPLRSKWRERETEIRINKGCCVKVKQANGGRPGIMHRHERRGGRSPKETTMPESMNRK